MLYNKNIDLKKGVDYKKNLKSFILDVRKKSVLFGLEICSLLVIFFIIILVFFEIGSKNF